MRKSFVGAAAAALFAASALVGVAETAAQAEPASCDWPMFGRDLGRSFAAAAECSEVNALNVATLQKKWFRDDIGPVTAQPVVDEGVLYVGSNQGVFYALDAEDGSTIWEFDVEDPSVTDYGIITATAAVETIDGVKVVVFAGAATLYVLKAADGTELAAACVDPAHVTPEEVDGGWDPCTAANATPQPDPDNPATVEIESSPAIVVNEPRAGAHETADVVVGMDYNEDIGIGPAGVISFVLKPNPADNWHLEAKWKYDPETQATYTAPAQDPLRHGNGTGHGCGNVWSSPMVDETDDLVVFGVGNCTFNDLGEAIIGVNLSDGLQRFRYAPREPMDPTAGDPDVDFGATPNLLPGGLVGEGGKDGHYYALDPDTIGTTGEPVWDANAAMNSDLGGMIGSTAVGQARGGPAVFASSGIPVNTREEFTFSSISQAFDQIVEGASNATVRIPPGGIHAIDATTGKVLWDAPAPPAYGGVVHVNGVVFLPATFGFSIQAYHADTGALLWEYPLVSNAGPLAPASPVTTVGNSIFFGSGMLLADPNAGGVWAMSLPALPSIG